MTGRSVSRSRRAACSVSYTHLDVYKRQDVNAIFLRMPISDSKRAEMETYATNLMKQLLDMRTDTQKFKICV